MQTDGFWHELQHERSVGERQLTEEPTKKVSLPWSSSSCRGSVSGSPVRALLAYHFFRPDDVVSARLFTDLAVGLQERGWEVTALTSVRSWADPTKRFAAHERWRGISIERVMRPAWDQRRPRQRMLNSAWMLSAWLVRALTLRPPFDAVIIGSDPAFAPLLVPVLRPLWPTTALAHWCYDLYPEAIEADGAGWAIRQLIPFARVLMGVAYRNCDAVVDLGPRMRERLSEYTTFATKRTLVPWALAEPSGGPRVANPAVRHSLFGDARLALLYSGTLGRAHEFQSFLALARICRQRTGNAIALCFSARGHNLEELQRRLSPDDTNVRIVSFSGEDGLERHLESADLHLLSLRAEWSGLVVPSKFFGSLAVGRPVLYDGPPDSDVARWISELEVGWDIQTLGLPKVVELLEHLARSPEELGATQRRARAAYDVHFRKELMIDGWDSLLREIVTVKRGALDRQFLGQT